MNWSRSQPRVELEPYKSLDAVRGTFYESHLKIFREDGLDTGISLTSYRKLPRVIIRG